jgi:hypothetical protein
LPALDASDEENDGEGDAYDIIAVALPKLERLIAAKLLVYFAK